jgi:hypothetical protein
MYAIELYQVGLSLMCSLVVYTGSRAFYCIPSYCDSEGIAESWRGKVGSGCF